jgi:asparagine synthase (glutamine-hydrolysing)
MCGIAGIIAPGGFEPQTLVAMTHLVSYRGPNGFGFAYAGRGTESRVEIIHNEDRAPSSTRPVVGLGSRRLAILDVSSLGNMPMEIDDGAFCVVFNGEIYNYKEVRQQLEPRGHAFRTGTDTEVILRAYQEWGEECLQHFNGMWSFAIWDRAKQKLFCARDRFGVKPFYYTVFGGRFYFGSEIKQITQASGMPRRANPRTVFHFLEWGLLDCSSETFFEGVYQLQGGHCLTLDLQHPIQPVIRRYWELIVEPEQELSVKKATEEFQARFESAVKLRLRSDVPVGVCLSGGLDSSAILCKAKEIAPEITFQTFSACFENKAIDERDYIAAVVAATGGVGHSIFPEGHAFWESIHSIAYHQDEPVGGASAFAQWCVMEDARKHGIPVVLGGQGGDEILCGYQKYRYFYLWHLLRHGDPKFFRESILWARNGTSSYGTLSSASRYLPAMFSRPFSLTQKLCTTQFRIESGGAEPGIGPASSIAERQKTDLTYSSIPTLLRHEDRNSMAHSVESRLPFLDYKLAEFSVNCPASLKLRDGWGKWLLRNAMEGTLPESVRLRKTKLGFDTPETEWMRLGLANGHRQIWETPKLRMERFLEASGLVRECRKFLHGTPGALSASSIFRAISLELWAQVHQVS